MSFDAEPSYRRSKNQKSVWRVISEVLNTCSGLFIRNHAVGKGTRRTKMIDKKMAEWPKDPSL